MLLVQMCLQLVNHFLDCFLADVIVLLNSRMEQSLDSESLFHLLAANRK